MIADENYFLLGVVSVLVALIVNIKYGLLMSTILLSGFLIMFVYNKKNTMEHYEPTTIGKPKMDRNVIYQKSPLRGCLTDSQFKYYADPARRKPQIVDKNMKSLNHNLEGAQNPKTLIPPIITLPSHDLNWRKGTQVVPNKINGETNENLYYSGYLSDKQDVSNSMINQRQVRYPETDKGEVIENYEYAQKTWDDSVLADNGYDPEQFRASNFPANFPQGNCMRNPKLAEYNKRIFTQNVQPGVYYRSDVIEPINSNIGISFQQQFNPRTFEEKDGNLEIVDHDPNFAPMSGEIIEYPDEPQIDNVYDPRFYGYGTSYRNYVDKVTGQPRFPYDDINATKMPNYIVRSKIDTHVFSDTYGPMQNGGLSLNEVRQKAQDVFYEDTTNFRNDITSKLMRKRNAELWQEKMFPKSRANFV